MEKEREKKREEGERNERHRGEREKRESNSWKIGRLQDALAKRDRESKREREVDVMQHTLLSH
jgi:hypothetical protein